MAHHQHHPELETEIESGEREALRHLDRFFASSRGNVQRSMVGAYGAFMHSLGELHALGGFSAPSGFVDRGWQLAEIMVSLIAQAR